MIPPINETRRGLRGAILTIDGSLSQTGWALTDQNGRRIQSGVFRSKSGPGWPADHRIYAIGRQLLELWPKLKTKPAHFGIEHQFFRAAAPGAKFQLRPEVVADLCRLEGVCVFIAKSADASIDVLQLRSTEWRGLLGVTTARGAAEGIKARGVAEVRKRLMDAGFSSGQVEHMFAEDELEAIGLGMAIHYELTNGYPMHTRRGQLKEENRARKARAKLPKISCAICRKVVRGKGVYLGPSSPVGDLLVHAKCRPRPANGK